MPVVPAIAKVHCHQDVVAQHTAAFANEADKLAIGHKIIEQHFHLQGAKARCKRGVELAPNFFHEIADTAALGEAWIDGAVGLQLRTTRATHQFVGGKAELLAR